MTGPVLVACERSGRVRDALIAQGIEAVSCDIEPTDQPGPHIQGDALVALHARPWAGLIAFPPCTHLAASGARWFPAKRRDGRQAAAIAFFLALANARHVPRRAVENPVGIMSTHHRRPDQIIQPYQFGHPESKATCLWLEGLPKLVPTNDLARARRCNGPEQKLRWDNQTPSGQNKLSPGPLRAYLRSLTYPGIAQAMAEQWAPVFAQTQWSI